MRHVYPVYLVHVIMHIFFREGSGPAGLIVTYKIAKLDHTRPPMSLGLLHDLLLPMSPVSLGLPSLQVGWTYVVSIYHVETNVPLLKMDNV